MFKNFKNGDKIWKAALAALVVGITLILFIFALFNINSISAFFRGVIGAMAAFIYGFALAFVCNPICKIFHKYVFNIVEKNRPHPEIRKLLSILSTYILFGSIIAIALFVILPDVIDNFTNLSQNIGTYVQDLLDYAEKFLLKVGVENPKTTINELLNKFLDLDVQANAESAEILNGLFTLLISKASALIFSVASHAMNILIGFILSIYFLLYKDSLLVRLKRFLCAFLPEPAYKRVVHFGKYTNNTIGRYLTGTLCDAVLVGCVVTLILTLFHFEYAALIGMICGITNVIPFFGPFLGAIPSGVLIFLQTPGDINEKFWRVVAFAVIILIVQQIDGNIIAPHILGESTGLTPIGIIAAVTLCSHLFGFIGMLIGVPLVAVISYIGSCLIEWRLRKKNLPTQIEVYQLGVDMYNGDFSNLYDENNLTQEIDVRKLDRLRKKTKTEEPKPAPNKIKIEHPTEVTLQDLEAVIDDDDDDQLEDSGETKKIDDSEMNNI